MIVATAPAAAKADTATSEGNRNIVERVHASLQSGDVSVLNEIFDRDRWDEAVTACPPGWRLPSDLDWKTLEIAIGMDAYDAHLERGRGAGLGDRLKPGGDTGFDALFSGYSDPHENDAFVRLGDRAAFWAATAAGRDDVSALARHRDVSADRSTIWRSKVNQTYRLSVRCVANPTP